MQFPTPMKATFIESAITTWCSAWNLLLMSEQKQNIIIIVRPENLRPYKRACSWTSVKYMCDSNFYPSNKLSCCTLSRAFDNLRGKNVKFRRILLGQIGRKISQLRTIFWGKFCWETIEKIWPILWEFSEQIFYFNHLLFQQQYRREMSQSQSFLYHGL